MGSLIARQSCARPFHGRCNHQQSSWFSAAPYCGAENHCLLCQVVPSRQRRLLSPHGYLVVYCCSKLFPIKTNGLWSNGQWSTVNGQWNNALFRRVRGGLYLYPARDILLFIVVLSCFQINHPHSLLYSLTPHSSFGFALVRPERPISQ